MKVSNKQLNEIADSLSVKGRSIMESGITLQSIGSELEETAKKIYSLTLSAQKVVVSEIKKVAGMKPVLLAEKKDFSSALIKEFSKEGLVYTKDLRKMSVSQLRKTFGAIPNALDEIGTFIHYNLNSNTKRGRPEGKSDKKEVVKINVANKKRGAKAVKLVDKGIFSAELLQAFTDKQMVSTKDLRVMSIVDIRGSFGHIKGALNQIGELLHYNIENRVKRGRPSIKENEVVVSKRGRAPLLLNDMDSFTPALKVKFFEQGIITSGDLRKIPKSTIRVMFAKSSFLKQIGTYLNYELVKTESLEGALINKIKVEKVKDKIVKKQTLEKLNISETTKDNLIEAGYNYVDSLLMASEEEIMAIKGFGAKRVKSVINAAKSCVA